MGTVQIHRRLSVQNPPAVRIRRPLSVQNPARLRCRPTTPHRLISHFHPLAFVMTQCSFIWVNQKETETANGLAKAALELSEIGATESGRGSMYMNGAPEPVARKLESDLA